MKLTIKEKIYTYPIVIISYILYFTVMQVISLIVHGKIKRNFGRFRKEIKETNETAVKKHRKSRLKREKNG